MQFFDSANFLTIVILGFAFGIGYGLGSVIISAILSGLRRG